MELRTRSVRSAAIRILRCSGTDADSPGKADCASAANREIPLNAKRVTSAARRAACAVERTVAASYSTAI
jgi:hypothetical protein